MSRHDHSADSAGTLLALVVIGIAFVLGLYSMHTLYFVVLALVPAAFAAIIEPRGQRAATISIASLTLATVTPLVLSTMLAGKQRDLLMSGTAWTFVGGAVLAGLAIFLSLPAAAAWHENQRAKRRIEALRKRQQEIEENWGSEVRTTVAR
jgi:uncharacterized membrane protein YccC